MNRVPTALTSIAMVLLLQCRLISQTQGNINQNPKPDPCYAAKQKSYTEGLKRGAQNETANSQKSWEDGFVKGADVEQTVFTVKVGDSSSLQKISIIVEDIDGSTSYQFAAAEVIKNYFSDFLTVTPESNLWLYIGGTKSMPLSSGGDIQSIDIDIEVQANQTILLGNEKRIVSGSLQLATQGGTLKNYSQDAKTQAVREYIYKALSKYKEKWEKAAPKTLQ